MLSWLLCLSLQGSELKLPLIVGFQDEQNRATAQASLHQWTVSVLKDARTDLRNIIEEQWYKPTLKAILLRRAKKGVQDDTQQPIAESPNTPEIEPQGQLQELESQLPNVPVVEEPQNVSAPVRPIDPNNPPFRIKMTFDDIVFDTFLEKSAAALGLLQAGAITKEICLKIAQIDEQYIAQMMQLWAEQEEAKLLKQQQSMTVDMEPATTPVPTAEEPPATAVIPNMPIATGQATAAASSSKEFDYVGGD